ncbi:PAS-domain containing protein [Allohahella sp. A8]|uniref:PAS domain-containing hybrid sensor histidine kinase/response regulator n=1 Tax=Allohahella sp. A8 TaxID=3141461 RepID=UPI003A812FDA
MFAALLILMVAGYLWLLFTIARRGDDTHFDNRTRFGHPLVFSLALGVYCTSWTFYGLVGTAATEGLSFLPILLGPVLLFVFGFRLLRRTLKITKRENIRSLADFLASRYGKRQGVATLTTLILLLATVPYIALQLKAVSATLAFLLPEHSLLLKNGTFLIMLSMMAFTLVFGTRRLDVTSYHGGLMGTIAFESVVKLVALMSVAVFAVALLNAELIDVSKDRHALEGSLFAVPGREEGVNWLNFLTQTLLSACAVFCLPRMFHVTFVECLSENHLRIARIIFPLFLLLIGLAVLVIAIAGDWLLQDVNVAADLFVIALPMRYDSPGLALFVFLGGFSAATAMIIVSTITLSQMLSNDVILPLYLRGVADRKGLREGSKVSSPLVIMRRATIVGVLLLAWVFHLTFPDTAGLTSLGLLAFAVVVQLAPAILGGLLWQGANAYGMYAGLAAGLSILGYTLAPLAIGAGTGAAGGSAGEAFSLSTLLALSANVTGLIVGSMLFRPKLIDRVQARSFTSSEAGGGRALAQAGASDILHGDLSGLLRQFLDAGTFRRIFAGQTGGAEARLSSDIIDHAKHALSGVVGVASAQRLVEDLRSETAVGIEDVVSIFEQTSKALQFNQEILSASFDNMSSAISVVNAELQVVAWNRRYEEMFSYPKGMLRVGVPVAELFRYNAEQDLLGEGPVDQLVHKRLKLLQENRPYKFVRHYPLGTVLEIEGRPLPNGGYVTSYDDVTALVQVQTALEKANVELERRVAERTATIQHINDELMKAKGEAELANRSKSKFLALATHDLLQPINAASLYAGSLLDISAGENRRDLSEIRKIHGALQSAEGIINSLLEVARLDTGSLKPEISDFPIDDLLRAIVDEFTVQLKPGCTLRYHPCRTWVRSDPIYLRRIIQNLVSNAVKYTSAGRIVLGCRRRGRDRLEVQVIDSGSGIGLADQAKIFDEFYRQPMHRNLEGIGLGLPVATRFSQLLQHPLRLRSESGKGSLFAIELPRVSEADVAAAVASDNANDSLDSGSPASASASRSLGLRVLCVDDEQQNLDALKSLLRRWNCEVSMATTSSQARALAGHSRPDVLLIDYQLQDVDQASEQHNGLVLAESLLAIWDKGSQASAPVMVCLITGAADDNLPRMASVRGFDFLKKPVKPAKLRALMDQYQRRAGREQQ